MPLPLILRKRLITRKDNEATNTISNYAAYSKTHKHAQKTSHESKSNCQAVKKTNCVPPKGIIFNYSLQKRSTHRKNDNKLITKENDNHTIIIDSDDENNDEPVLDDINIIPNKMYKVVIVDGNIRLVEYNAADIVEENGEANNDENGEANNDENDSDEELIDTDDHVDANEKRDDSLRNYEITKEANTGSENEINQQNNCTVPEVLNHNLRSAPAEKNTERDLDKSLVNKLESINGPNSSNNNIHATKKYLAEARTGKAMVLLPLQKYTTLKKKLADIQKEKKEWLVLKAEYRKEKEKWLELEAKRIKEKIEAEKNIVRKNSIGVQTAKCHGAELEELHSLKSRLTKIFTEAQVNMISNSKKLKDIVWSDSEMERVVFLKQIISQTAYVFLKYKMHFPLPPLPAVKQWMIKKNIYVKPKRKEKIQKLAENNTTVAGEELNLDSTQNPPPSELLNAEDIQTLQTNTEVSETTQAVNTIIDDQPPQDVEFGNTLQVHHTLSAATDTGEQLLFYTYDNLNNDNDANNADYLPDDNIASVEEVVHSEEVKPQRVIAAAIIRCRLCLRPFETDEEMRAHVPLHYYNTYYTSYLDAVKPFVCEFCNEPVKHRLELVQHHRTHLGINPFKCWFPGCTYTGKNMSTLRSHHDSHKALSFKCPECGALFKTRKYMRGHLARRHAARALLRCELCPATCLTLYTYRKHVDSHQRPPRIKCTEAGCEESFYCRASLRSHVLGQHRTSTRPHRCHLCPRAHYTNETQLNKHLQRHEMNKISHCVKCLKVFYDYGEYYTHYMEHKDSEHKCKCTCGQRFFTQEQLEEHKLQCAFVKGDSTKKYRKRKRKTENERNTKKADTPNRKKAIRKVIIKNNTNSSLPQNNSIVPDKLHEGNITEEQKNNEEQNSEENKSFEHKRLALIGAEQKVITLQISNNQAVIKLANNYPNIPNTQQVISTTDRQLQKYISKTYLKPRSDKKVHTISPLQQIVNANAGSLQQTVLTNVGSQQESCFPVTDNRKVISVPENNFPKLTVMPLNYQQNVYSVSENVSQNFISVQSRQQKDFVGSCSPDLNNVLQENEVPPPNNQNKIVQEGEPHKHETKHIITKSNAHFPKKLTPIPKGSALEKMIAISTKDKILPGPQGNYIKKVLALPKDSLLQRIITVPENPIPKAVTDKSPLKTVVTEAESPVNNILGDHGSPFQTVTTHDERLKEMVAKHYESPEKKVTTYHEIPIESVNISDNCPIIDHRVVAKNFEAVPESASKKVIVIPEMQYQNKIVTIFNKNIHKPENSIPIDKQGKKVIKILQTDGTTSIKPSNKKVGPILGKKKLQKITVISRQQLLAALANRKNNLIPISKSIINKKQEDRQEIEEMQLVQGTPNQPNMPILDY